MTTTTVYAAPMPSPCCPRCHGTDVRPGRIGVAGGYQYEMVCRTCDLWEDRSSDAQDFAAWWERWHPTAVPASLAAVCADPEADAPRIAYADAAESTQPARAELIRIQLARALAERGARALVSEPGRRELELLARHATDWVSTVAPFVRPVEQPRPDPGWRFERGFVSFVRLDAASLLTLGEQLFALAPIRHLDVDNRSPVTAVLASPLFAHLRSLGLTGCKLDDEAAIALAMNPHLAGLRWLDLRDNNIGAPGVAALAASPHVRAIPVVHLGGNPGDPAQQYSLDWDNSVADSWLPPEGAALEQTLGPIPWLHLPPFHLLPDRFHTR